MEHAVLALKAKKDKAGLVAMAYEIMQITTQCVKHDVQLVDCIITFGGTKDILREVRKLDAKKQFDSLVIYSPSQIAKDKEEYSAFVVALKEDFDISVRFIRSPQ